jgi:hypothetical protein
MDRYIAQVYADGQAGYEAEHQSWWASDATAGTGDIIFTHMGLRYRF